VHTHTHIYITNSESKERKEKKIKKNPRLLEKSLYYKNTFNSEVAEFTDLPEYKTTHDTSYRISIYIC